MIGRLMGPGISDIVLIDSFAASLFTLDDKELNDGRVLSFFPFLKRHFRETEDRERFRDLVNEMSYVFANDQA